MESKSFPLSVSLFSKYHIAQDTLVVLLTFVCTYYKQPALQDLFCLGEVVANIVVTPKKKWGL